jgi:hypothetical protein
MVLQWLDSVSWLWIVIVCATLGLAPFNPPHVVEKLLMLSRGELVRAIDWFDLLMHGAPWIVLILKAGSVVLRPKGA